MIEGRSGGCDHFGGPLKDIDDVGGESLPSTTAQETAAKEPPGNLPASCAQLWPQSAAHGGSCTALQLHEK